MRHREKSSHPAQACVAGPLVWSSLLLLRGACNDILGCEEGKPYPPDAPRDHMDVSTSTLPDGSPDEQAFDTSDGGEIQPDTTVSAMDGSDVDLVDAPTDASGTRVCQSSSE